MGAGASRPAGIQTIDEMTKEFLSNPKLDEDHGGSEMSGELPLNPIRQVLDVVKDYFGKMDLELIMSLILQLEDKKFRDLFSKKYPIINELVWEEDPDSNYWKNMNNLKMLIQQHIRKKCEEIKTTEYLWTIKSLVQSKPINIFTLNYDGTIEIFCEKNGIVITDGFDPYWNYENFGKESEVNLFKLHGSLYWIKTESGKLIKIPIKGLEISNLKYLTDERVSEMMIYPTLQKNKQMGIYSWLNQKFKDELKISDLCVIIGYSFRDEDVKETLIESLLGNPNLWFLLVSPNASSHKKTHFLENRDISSRVITMDMGIEEGLRERNIHEYLMILRTARSAEERSWHAQSQSKMRLDYDGWNFVLGNYLRINHHDRIKWIVEKLSSEKFSEISGRFPECIEGTIGPTSIQYVFDYLKDNNKDKLELWEKIFVDFCIALEYALFMRINVELRKINPIQENELPQWCLTSGGGTVPNEALNHTITQIKRILINKIDVNLRSKLEKLLRTLEIWSGYWTNNFDINKMYQDENLGIKKLALEIIDFIK